MKRNIIFFVIVVICFLGCGHYYFDTIEFLDKKYNKLKYSSAYPETRIDTYKYLNKILTNEKYIDFFQKYSINDVFIFLKTTVWHEDIRLEAYSNKGIEYIVFNNYEIKANGEKKIYKELNEKLHFVYNEKYKFYELEEKNWDNYIHMMKLGYDVKYKDKVEIIIDATVKNEGIEERKKIKIDAKIGKDEGYGLIIE